MNELVFLLIIGLDPGAQVMLVPKILPTTSVLECEQNALTIRSYAKAELPELVVLTKCVPASDMVTE